MAAMDDLLGALYHADQVTHDHKKVAALIADAKTSDPAFENNLHTKLVELQHVRAARSKGMTCGCHVTATLCEILERHFK